MGPEELSDEQVAAIGETLPAVHVPYCPHTPTAKQEWFLLLDELEAFFGGASGPGKSWGLLMGALQHVDRGDYHALLLRPALTEFEQPGGLMKVAEDWLSGHGANSPWWHGGRREWKFPSGATLRFGYLANLADLRHYHGIAYSFVGFDELTGFDERVYRGMFRVLRKAKDALPGVPLRMRSASNPGGPGHGWCKARFVDPITRASGAVFVKATIHDNPHLDYEEFLLSLAHLDPVDRLRLIAGDWDVAEEGGKFDRHAFRIVSPDKVGKPVKVVRYWDLAASEPSPSNPDPDYTVGLRLEVDAAGIFTIRHVVRGRLTDDRVEQEVRRTAEEDAAELGRGGIAVYVEQEPGASGKLLVSHFKRKVLQGFVCYGGLPRGGDKEVRARPVAAAAANGLVQIVEGCPHLIEFLDELAIFPQGNHDDCVDALSGAHAKLAAGPGASQVRAVAPRGRVPSAIQPGRTPEWRPGTLPVAR